MKIDAWDIETLKNCFTGVFIDIQSGEKREFVIHKSRNDFPDLVDHVLSRDGLVGFNSVRFDYAVLHPFLENPDKYRSYTGDRLAKAIYKRAQKIIDAERFEFITPLVPQRDLYLIWHFNNRARSTSLKWLQFNMGWKNVQEMPIPHNEDVTAEQIPTILEYNTNDVESTIAFYHLSKSRISLRKTLSAKYGVDMSNFSDNRIGEEIFLIGLSEKTGKTRKELKGYKTYRPFVQVSDCLIDGLQFQTPQFQKIHSAYERMTIYNTKTDGETMKAELDGVVYEFGLGGLHGFREPGVYHNIVSADVSSYYPNLAISQGFHPEHLGQAFCEVYKELYEERKKYPKGSDESNAIKLSLNGTFGQSNAEWSVFYDPKFTMSITINGQLLLALLCESITVSGAGRIIMANTDGIEVDVKDTRLFEKVCENWQKRYSLSLEFSVYSMLACRDVNNYLGQFDNGKIKAKGAFEVDREIFKDNSMKIVPYAVQQFFVNNTPISETIENCNDIGMFLLGNRAKTGDLEYRKADTGELERIPLPRTVRYYVSKSGGSIVKVTEAKKKKKELESPNQLNLFDLAPIEAPETTEKIINLHVGRRMTLFNVWQTRPFGDYLVDIEFYKQEAQKLIDSVVKNQTVFA